MYELPQKLKELRPYEHITGQYQVRLDANESFLSAPDWMRAEIAQKVGAIDFHRYPDPLCTELRQGFGDFFGVDPSLVTVGNGSDELISILVNSFLQPGERMALLQPDFSMYRIYAEMAGAATAVYEKAQDTLQIDVDSLIAFVREKQARLLMLSNPCNPTAQALSLSEVRRLVESLDCLVVIDEAYMEFSDGSILSLVGDFDNLIVLKTCSKIGMAAIRLGFAIANPLLTGVLQAVRSPYNVNAMTQAVGCVWFSHGQYLRDCVEQICASRDALYEALCGISEKLGAALTVLPSRANFVFVRPVDAKVVFSALKQRGIIVRQMGDYLRITAGSPEENACLLQALEEILR